MVRSGEKARKAQRKSLEWGFARKSGGQYGVSKLRGWRKEFYCEFRWRIFSHGWHEYTTRGCSCLCCTNQTATHPTECTEHTEPSAERDSHGWHGWTQMLGCFQGDALVSSAPTEQEVHQPSKIDILPQISLCTDVRLRRI